MKVNLVVSFLVLAMIIASCVTPLIDLSLKYDLATETAAAANQNNRFSREQCGLATGGREASPSSKPPPPPAQIGNRNHNASTTIKTILSFS